MRFIEETEEEEKERADTEITLGMRSLLGVFFGLVLICGIFFGLGYSLGRGSARPASVISSDATAKAVPKPMPPPAANSPNEDDSANPATYTPGPDAQESAAASSAPAPQKPSATVIRQVTPVPALTAASAPPKPAITSPAPMAPPASAAAPASSARAGPPTMVQIAAISRQQDADVLVAALKKHGYSAIARTDPRDNLLHVQIGPFATREEAHAMRAKLLADGYNAILK